MLSGVIFSVSGYAEEERRKCVTRLSEMMGQLGETI